MTSYLCSTVTTALSRVIYEIFNVDIYRDLEISVKAIMQKLLNPFYKIR